MNLALLILTMLQYYDINCKPVITLLYLLTIQLMVYNRTITRFIADDNLLISEWEGGIRFASDNSWARHRLKHVSWRSRWIIFYVYTWIEYGSFVHNLTSWQMPFWLVLLTERKVFHTHTRQTRSTAACRTIVPVFWLLFSRLSMLPSFQHLSGNLLNALRAPHCLDG